jgi:hypothetical protein
MRAMTFERLVRDQRFVSQLLTTAVGALGLDRPRAVHRRDGHVSHATTATELSDAHQRAVGSQEATIITGLAVPFVGLEAEPTATSVKPDFAIVTVRPAADAKDVGGSWLIVGDAKDYERVRSRIDDQRMLKGFLQVALGAESVDCWSQLPEGMRVHAWGALAVPRNAFLQPEAVVERLDDHRREVRVRAVERLALLGHDRKRISDLTELEAAVNHLEATFDPRTCVTCSLFNYCRSELRTRDTVEALLVELGVRPDQRPALEDYLGNGALPLGAPSSVVKALDATTTGFAQNTGQLRVDPVGELGTVEIVLAKADSAALGLHGLGVRRVLRSGDYEAWKVEVFQDPQSPKTRIQAMKVIGNALKAAMSELEDASGQAPDPVHVVVPDAVTADVLVSIADSLAGVETSRLRWERDIEAGREPLTFDGEPAAVPSALAPAARLAVSFLLEADRARAMRMRFPLVDLREVLAAHFVPGGPAVDAGRLDYLVAWAEARVPLDHRVVSDAVAASEQTPGARLSNERSDAIHEARRGVHSKRGRGKPDPARYDALVRDELAFKCKVVERAVAVLSGIKRSRLQPVYRSLEREAQLVWRRRLRLRASDMVRFGRTSDVWRNRQVELRDADDKCSEQLLAVGSPVAALDMAIDAGTRVVARATVTSTKPLRVAVDSRHLREGSQIVALTIDGEPCIETSSEALAIQKGSFKAGGFSIGELLPRGRGDQEDGLIWNVLLPLNARIGSSLVVADADWFKTFASGHQIAIERPPLDSVNAPTKDCDPDSYRSDPEGHRYCCRPQEIAEAEIADWLAERRARGELNPTVWPPVVDDDQFDVSAKDAPTAADEAKNVADTPDADLTIDDLD